MPSEMSTVCSPVAEELLDKAVATVDTILQGPEWLLNPGGDDAQKIADDARCFMKLFFEAAQMHNPAQRQEDTGLDSLVVDGFHRDQIWEELEVQNVPLRRQLRRVLAKLSDAPKGELDLSFSEHPLTESRTDSPEAHEQESKVVARKAKTRGTAAKATPGEEENGTGDEEQAGPAPDASDEEQGPDLFDMDEMRKFSDLADAGKLMLGEDGESDIDAMEASDDDDDEAGVKGKDAKFKDFFAPASDSGAQAEKSSVTKKKAKKRRAKADDDDLGIDDDDEKEDESDANDDDDVDAKFEKGRLAAEEAEEEDDDDGGDDEKELEAKIRELQQDDAEGDSDSDDGADEGQAAMKESRQKSLYEMDKRLRSLEEEVAKLEEEQLEEKPWSLRGEVSAKQRPLNSLLEVHLDQPMTNFAGRRAEAAAIAAGTDPDNEGLDDVPGADGLIKPQHFDVEAIVRQRVWDEMFDDVVRKTVLPPSQRPQHAEDDAAESLNFEKSRVGLGDVYAQQYEAEMMGHKTETETKDDQEKAETKALFAKLMYKLDQLTNAHFTPRPPMLGTSGEHVAKAASLKMEETIPLLVSDAHLKAPEELRAPRRHERGRDELSHEERAAARRGKKAMRRKKLERKIETGEMTLAGRRERDQKLGAKNEEAKRDRAKKGEVKDRQKRLKASELLQEASENAANFAANREEARRERRKQSAAGGTPSKRLKL
mmetsp:Transcript_81237/g.230115  ORF Transcript_81237/g.230115 Transcript_81237/m.230115 type:complete len:712 (+) Transcript_81237:136-2271(+)